MGLGANVLEIWIAYESNKFAFLIGQFENDNSRDQKKLPKGLLTAGCNR